MTEYLITREVIEWIEVEAANEDEADIHASESPIEEWVRDIKDTSIEEVGHDTGRR